MPEPRPHEDLTGFRLLLAGGGSGGHVFPALAVAAEAQARGASVEYLGRPSGMEAELVPQRGIPYHSVPARPVVGRGPLQVAAAAWTLAGSAWRARGILRRQRADALLGTGGYVAAPGVLGARLAGRPAVLVEPNAQPGAANRFLSRFATGACIAFPETAAALRCPAWVTGVPVREEFFALPAELPPGPPRILVLGGSQGARELNRLLPGALSRLAGAGPLSVLHQCGRGNEASTREAYAAVELGAVEVQVEPFLDAMAAAVGASHLVVSRAGAITLAELCAAGRPSVLVPLSLAEGHQGRNAAALAEAGAARVLTDPTPEGLAALLGELVADPEGLAAMARAARGLARPSAAADILERTVEATR